MEPRLNEIETSALPPVSTRPPVGGSVDNQAFLERMFGEREVETEPILVGFEGNPHSASRSQWAGTPWAGDETPCESHKNNYFSLAAFRPDDSGKFRRKKSRFASLHAVMLDDVGTKIPLERVSLAPSWCLETSPGNYQVGFALAEPINDPGLADRLMNAVVAAGLCDPGANGPCARLARLPVGVNGKHMPPFVCRMETWNPHLRYTLEDLVHGLGLEMRATQHRRRSSVDPNSLREFTEPVVLRSPAENAVIAALISKGRYLSSQASGVHSVVCPWVDQHSEGDPSGTAYFEPTDEWPLGGFKCHHGHCSGRGIQDLLSFLDIDPAKARMRSTIRVVPGELDRVVDAAERELAQSGRFFQRGGLIVSVHAAPGTWEVRVEQACPLALQRALAGLVCWERFDARKGRNVPIDPPPKHTMVLNASTEYPHLPILRGVARQPYLRADGSLVVEPGYDLATGIFGAFQPAGCEVPESPTRTQAEQGLALLKEALQEFDFQDPTDHAAALAACLTASVRTSLASAPMFHVRSHQSGSGKSYLCELVSAFATPNRATPAAFPCSDKECSKLLLAELIRGPATIVFDNLNSDLLPYKSLCTAVTSEYLLGRILGVSKTVSVGTRTLFLSSGNNVGPICDMTRRCVTIRLSPECEIPAARTYARPDLLREVLAGRGRHVSAALTIVRAWIVAGRPRAHCRVLAGYGDWSDLCCQPLLWLGVPDPTVGVFDAMADDPDQAILVRFLNAWRGVFGTAEARVRDALEPAGSQGPRQELIEVLEEIAGGHGDVNRKKLGWWIRNHSGRILDGKRVVSSKSKGTTERWRVETVPVATKIPSGSVVPIATDRKVLATTAV